MKVLNSEPKSIKRAFERIKDAFFVKIQTKIFIITYHPFMIAQKSQNSIRQDDLSESMEQDFFKAIDENNVKRMTELCRMGVSVNIQDNEGLTPAMRAILRGHRQCLGELMNRGFDYNLHDMHGQTVFDYFPRFGCLSTERLASASSLMAKLSINDVIDRSK